MNDRNELIINAASCSIAGNTKGTNEDNVFFNGDYITKDIINNDYSVKTGEVQNINLFAVFDGMGSRSRGALASNIAAGRLADTYAAVCGSDFDEVDNIILDYINGTNEAISVASRRSEKRCGTTFAALYADKRTAVAYNIGDSCVFLFRGGELFQITREHISTGGNDSFSGEKFDNRVSQFLGLYENERELEPFRSKNIILQKGDKFLLCTDGITDNITRDIIADIMSKNRDAFSTANELCRVAELSGSQDNMSATVVTVDAPGFHITANMITAAVIAGIFIVGFLFGYLAGHLMGSSNYSKNEATDSDYTYSETVISSEDEDEDEETEDVESTESGEVTQSESESKESENSQEESSNVTKIKMAKSDITLEYLETFQLSVKFTPKNASDEIIWESDDTNAVTVDSNGVVKGVGAGKYAVITATGKNSGKKTTCVVRVKIPENTEVTTTSTTTKTEEDVVG